MLVIPAIDIKGGSCVRLLHGDPQQETVYSSDPVETAKRWVAFGAKRLHIVDLDGAFTGDLTNLDIARRIAEETGAFVQFGGGMRSLEAVQRVLSSGISRAIVGTALLTDSTWVELALREFAGRLMASVDARDGEVMVKGWQAGSGMKVPEVLSRIEKLGIREIVFTDIGKDGTLEGPNVAAIRSVLQSTRMAVYASGGISSVEDVTTLKALEPEGLRGCVIGKALYAGKISLPAAFAAASAQ
jgi:phosphoribosylformimino-5-aminoimidazole carboxamide ribotide isomerase